MMSNLKVLILGKGNIGQAVYYYLKKDRAVKKAAFFAEEKKIKNFDLLIGALPSQIGQKGLNLALKYRKDLIDISDVSIPFYLKKKKEIEKRGIRVIPGCGVSPGLVNLFSGQSSLFFDRLKSLEISSGTLAPKEKFFFPVTWSFDDLVEEHLTKAILIKNGKKIKMPPFAGYKKEFLKNIGQFESYFVQEWSSLIYTLKVKDLSFRVIRPIGFFHFFQFLKNHQFLREKRLPFAKEAIMEKKKDNLTLALVKMKGLKRGREKEIAWQAFSFSKAKEKLNSMQKITALVSLAVLKIIFEEKTKERGVLFLEEIGKDKKAFERILKEIRKEKILIKKSES